MTSVVLRAEILDVVPQAPYSPNTLYYVKRPQDAYAQLYKSNLAGTAITGFGSQSALTATKLETPRTINGVQFDGSQDINVSDFASKENSQANINIFIKTSIDINDSNFSGKLWTLEVKGSSGLNLSADGVFINGGVVDLTVQGFIDTANSTLAASKYAMEHGTNGVRILRICAHEGKLCFFLAVFNGNRSLRFRLSFPGSNKNYVTPNDISYTSLPGGTSLLEAIGINRLYRTSDFIPPSIFTIPADSNLNFYTIIGEHFADLATTATLLNCPVSKPFGLKVFKTGQIPDGASFYTPIVQEIRAHDPDSQRVWFRSLNPVTQVWTDWGYRFDTSNLPPKLAMPRNINGVPFDGSQDIAISEFTTVFERDFPDGTLIKTNIDISNTIPWLLEIKANGYGNGVISLMVQGYIYKNETTDTVAYNPSAIVVGKWPSNNIAAFALNNKLCFWFPNQGYWLGYSVRLTQQFASDRGNRVVSVENSAMPTVGVRLVSNIAVARTRLSSDPEGSIDTAFYLNFADSRRVQPNTTGMFNNFRGLRPFFVSKYGIEENSDNWENLGGTDYGDLLVLDGYSDRSGGRVNALYIGRTQVKGIWHYQSNEDGSRWEAGKRLAYASEIGGYAIADANYVMINDTTAKTTIITMKSNTSVEVALSPGEKRTLHINPAGFTVSWLGNVGAWSPVDDTAFPSLLNGYYNVIEFEGLLNGNVLLTYKGFV